MQTPWCCTRGPSLVEPSGSFLTSPPGKESLAAGKSNNQQQIPGLGTQGCAFNQSPSAAQDILPLHLVFMENFNASFKNWPKSLQPKLYQSHRFICRQLLQGTSYCIQACFSPADFIFCSLGRLSWEVLEPLLWLFPSPRDPFLVPIPTYTS